MKDLCSYQISNVFPPYATSQPNYILCLIPYYQTSYAPLPTNQTCVSFPPNISRLSPLRPNEILSCVPIPLNNNISRLCIIPYVPTETQLVPPSLLTYLILSFEVICVPYVSTELQYNLNLLPS
jgi:hypothetical protein